MAELNALVNPTQQQVLQAQQRAIDRAGNLATSITGVASREQALIREALVEQDLESGAQNGWNGSDREWVQSGLTGDSEEEVYNVNSNGNAENKVLVFYGLANVAADPLTSEVIFKDGTGATFARFNCEALEVAEISDFVIYDRPIVFGSTEDGDIYQWPSSGGSDRLVHLVKVVEPLGETLSTRERPESRLAVPGGGGGVGGGPP